LPSGAAAYEALKHQVPTVGACGVGRVKVELFPLVVAVVVEPMLGPPVHGVTGGIAWHSVQLTVPVGGPPTELPSAVAVSPQGLPTAGSLGGTTAVVSPLVTAMTLKHSAASTVVAGGAMLSDEPV
jgi:hypothetical protein